MKKILFGVLAAVAVISFGLMRGKATAPQREVPVAEKTTREEILPKAQAAVQAIRNDQAGIPMDELDERIAELDRVIENSNMIAKLNRDDLSDEIRTEFYRVIEVKQALLNEKVRQELARSQSLFQNR